MFDDNYFYIGNEDEYVNASGETLDGRTVGLSAGPDGNIETTFGRINRFQYNICKIVSGSTPEALEIIAKTYALVVEVGVHKASCIKVAEAAKIIDNTQRDVNIALMNELSMIFNKMGINTYEVLEAAGTKWNFLKFYPGLVGGHCIGVDPYYLTFKAKEFRHHPIMIESGRCINDNMGFFIAEMIIKKIIELGNPIKGCNILVMGATFKENVTDIRNSKVADIVHELQSYGVNVDVVTVIEQFTLNNTFDQLNDKELVYD